MSLLGRLRAWWRREERAQAELERDARRYEHRHLDHHDQEDE